MSPLSIEQERMCENSLTFDVSIASMEMVDYKSPTMDDFLCEFYKAAWEFFKPNLLHVCKEAIRKQSLGEYINKGFIIFISKPSDLAYYQLDSFHIVKCIL
jgi:hypothetical protein